MPFSPLAQGFPRSALTLCIIGQILFLLGTKLIITKMGPWPEVERHLPFEGFLRHSLQEEVTGRKQYLKPSGPDTCCDLLMCAFVQQTLTKRLLGTRCSCNIQEGTENKMQISLCKTNYNFKLRAFSPLPYASYAEVTSLSSGSTKNASFCSWVTRCLLLVPFPHEYTEFDTWRSQILAWLEACDFSTGN